MAERELKIKLTAVSGTSSGGDPMKKMAEEARKADVAVKSVDRSWKDVANLATAGGSLDGFAKNLAKIKSDNAFAKLSADILRGSKNLDDFNAKMLRAQKIQSQNAGAMSAFQKFQSGGAGGDGASAGGLLGAGGRFGPAGLAVAAGGIMGRDAATLFGLKSAGAGLYDLRKGEGGTILNTIAGVKDTLSGRDFRDRRDNEAAEKASQRVQLEHLLANNRAGIQDARASIGRFTGEIDPMKRLVAQRQMVGVQSGIIENRLRGGENEFKGLDREVGDLMANRKAAVAGAFAKRDAFNQDVAARKGTGGEYSEQFVQDQRLKLNKGILGAQENGLQAEVASKEKLLSLTKLRLADETKLGDTMKMQVQLAEQSLVAKRTEMQGQKVDFAQLDPAQREEAIRLRAKLTSGEQLSGEEERIAGGLGVLSKDLQKRQMENLDKGPEWMRFIQAGPDANLAKQAGQALATQNFTLELKFDEDAVLEKMRKEWGPLFDRIQLLGEKVITLEQQVQMDKQKVQVGQNRLFKP